MKILQVMTELGYGGAEKVVLELSRRLVSGGHQVRLTVLKHSPEQNMTGEFIKIGITPDVIGMDSPADFPLVFKLRRIIREFRPDVIHSHMMHPNLAARIANIGTKIPLVNTIHIAEHRSGQWIYFLADSMTNFLCTRYTAVSDAAARYHEHAAHLTKGSILTIRNGSDPCTKLSQEDLQKVKDQLNLNMCSRILGCIGRLDPQKGFDRLFRVLPELQKLVPENEVWGIVIFGEGPARAALEKQIRALPLRNIIVRMPGFVENAAALLNFCSAFAMPSRYEGYGLALAEAMNSGIPVVYAPVDSLPELAQCYADSYPADFAKPEKDAETAQILARVMNTPRNLPLPLYSEDQMSGEYLKLYQSLLKK